MFRRNKKERAIIDTLEVLFFGFLFTLPCSFLFWCYFSCGRLCLYGFSLGWLFCELASGNCNHSKVFSSALWRAGNILPTKQTRRSVGIAVFILLTTDLTGSNYFCHWAYSASAAFSPKTVYVHRTPATPQAPARASASKF